MALLADIESAVLARIQTKWPAGTQKLAEFDVCTEVGAITCPGIHVAAETTGFKKVTGKIYSKTIRVSVWLIFQHLGTPKSRRQGAHPIVEAIEILLAGKDLGLEIAPLALLRSPEVTDEEVRGQKRIAFRLELETNADIAVASEEEAVDLLSIGVKYYLKPGDDVADLEDTITIPHGG